MMRIGVGVVALAGLAGAVLTVVGVRSPVVGALTLVFLLFTPALCLALLLTKLDLAGKAIVGGTLSVTLLVSTAEIMLVASAWSPRGGVLAVATVCALLSLVAGVRRLRRGPAEPPAPEKPDDDAWVFEA
jgi:hypothetical protein